MLAQTKRRGHFDGETYSTVDLRKKGLHLYAESPDTNVWCVCFAIDDDPIQTWLPGQPCPQDVVDLVENGGELWSHNAAFERMIWKHILTPRYGWPLPRFDQWNCTMARAYVQALPGALDGAAASVGLGMAKDADGYSLMLRMAKPRRLEADGTPVWWSDDPVRLQKLIGYCRQDVTVERALHMRLNELSAMERQVWLLDQVINDRGICIDQPLCETARTLVTEALARLNAEIRQVSRGAIASVNSVAQIIAYCDAKAVVDVESIRADELERLLAGELPDDVRRVLEIRQEASLASVKKIDALLQGMCADGRVRGLLHYHAATTGRWSGKRFQPQNLRRPRIGDQETLIKLIQTGKASTIEMLGGPVLSVVSDVLRGMIVAAPGAQLYAADYSNIEGRVLAWLADETWKVDAFEAYDMGEGPDIYKLAYARSFHIPVEKVSKDQRQIGKVLELACGFGGGTGAFQSMAYNYKVKVSDARADELKTAWRDAHPNIVRYWYDIERAAMQAVSDPTKAVHCGKVSFRKAGSFLYARLPSGRWLSYPYPKLQNIKTPWGDHKLALTHKSQITLANARRIVKEDHDGNGKWARINTYGGCIVENLTQAVARDIMAEAMLRVEAAGYPIILTVHDEIVSEAPSGNVKEFCELMERRPDWGQGIPIVAEAWTGGRYRKD